MKREGELKQIMKRLLEQNAKGVLTDDVFSEMMKEYQEERMVTANGIKECEEALKSDPVGNARLFAELLKGYKSSFDELTREIILTLVEKIEVHESESGYRKHKDRVQRVEINFKHLGMIGEPVMVS
jgi:hypothetical protein